jgi:hypothetical protein
MLLRFHGSAGVNEFMCDQWERKWIHHHHLLPLALQPTVGFGLSEMNTYIHTSICLMRYGTRGKCPSFYCNDFSWLLNCMFILVFICNSTVQLIPVRAVTCDRPGSARACITFRVRCWVFLRAELCWSTFSSMATRRSLTDRDITELVENQTLMHIQWKTTFLLRVTVILLLQTVGLLYL